MSNMTIGKARQLQNKLSGDIAKLVETFEARTNVQIDRIYLDRELFQRIDSNVEILNEVKIFTKPL